MTEDGLPTLGDIVVDPITEFSGTVTSITRFLYGCERCCVTAGTLDSDRRPVEAHFDIAQLRIIDRGKHVPEPRNYPVPPGGPERASSPAPAGSSPAGAVR